MKTRIAALAAIITVAGAGAVPASEQSKILVSHGLVAIAEERDSEALESFEAAVAADPSDAIALYYRGVTRGRLGDLDGAVGDFESALREQPDFPRARFELGVALLQSGRDAEAVPHLLAVRDDHEVGRRATLFAGIAHLRLGDLDAAEPLLEEAQLDDEQEVAATYYRGVVEHRRGNRYRSRALLERVLAAAPESVTAGEARALLDHIGPDDPSYRLSAFAGLQYDSNVLLAPSGAAARNDLRISDEADGRAVLGGSARWIPLRADFGRVQVGYDFHQSLHFDLREFDIQSHGVGGDVSGVYRDFDWGLYGWFDFHLLDGSRFLSRLTFLPWLGWRANDYLRTEISARLRSDDFYGEEFGLRDANHGLFGLRQFVHWSDARFAWAGYRFDTVDAASQATASKRFEFDGHEVELGGYWEFVPNFGLEADYAFRTEHYAGASRVRFDGGSGLQNRRRDDVHRVQVAARLDIGRHVSLLPAVAFTDSRSNQAEFRYDRTVVSIAVEARL